MRLKKLFAVSAFVCIVVILVNVFKNYERYSRYYTRLQHYSHHQVSHLPEVEEQTCIQPQLPVWDPSANFTHSCGPIICTDDENWVYTQNGRFYINQKAVDKHGKIMCVIQPIVNNQDKAVYLPKMSHALNGSILKYDAFKVTCSGNDKKRYVNVHAGVSFENRSVNVNNEKFNVLIVGFDSMSRQAFQRFLPKSRAYFEETLGGTLLQNFNVLGDGTTQNLLPMLTGKTETEIPEVRRGKPNVRHVDEAVEFIWKRYERQGYVTSWAEDMATLGTFQYRMIGFKHQPVHHYLRPYFLEAEKSKRLFPRYCIGSLPQHKVFFNWMREVLDTNADFPFFTFGFFNEYSHNDNSCIGKVDDELSMFLEYSSTHKTINKTFIFFMGDHGLRNGLSRQTEQGKLEERMPYYAVYMPKDFIDKFPSKYNNLMINSKRLVTHFDIYETLREILDDVEDISYAQINGSKEMTPRAYSLFTPIPANRTCADADIEPHWCACLQWDNVPIESPRVKMIANIVVSQLNSYLSDVTSMCRNLELHGIIKAVKLRSNKQLLQFKKSKDSDGRVPDLTDQLKENKEFWQVTIETTPGGGVFEVTSSISMATRKVTVNDKDISRLNLYNDSPKCIAETYPSLRPYCVCFSP